MFWKRKKSGPVDPRTLDWGNVTPEFANSERRVALHVVNHELGSAADVDRTCRFLRGRLAWFQTQLPPRWQQHVHIDDRGQTVSPDGRATLRASLGGAQRVVFMSEQQG